MTHTYSARQTAALRARVTARTLLRYRDGALAAEDLPAHVRAGSAMAVTARRIAVVQDDTNAIAIIDRASGAVSSLLLPRGEGGARMFGEDRGNKQHKLDLEACVYVADRGMLLAFGSGSKPARERVVVVSNLDGDPTAKVCDATALYRAFKSDVRFAGSELNVEGVARVGERLRFFQRGNGAVRDGVEPVDATADVSIDRVLAALDDASATVALEHVKRFSLGAMGGVRLTFTDAWSDGDEPVWFLAAAEDSPDTYRDGVVAGSAIGWIDGAGDGYWCAIEAEDGGPFRDKAEGLALDPARPDRAWIVVDKDDTTAPCELCELALERRG
ncbi:MAG: hypothetical protein JNK05_15820 [Myxococcales bacterium]|nr:hypothetical protein [Myxococcales bacterium]